MSDDMISQLAESFLTGNTTEVADIITFSEAPWGLNFTLTPVQRVVLKVYYGLELDNKIKGIPVYDIIKSELLYEYTEYEFQKWLYEEGRTNLHPDELKLDPYKELVLVLGRRAGKSTISACISAYEMYKLIKRGDPSDFYGFPADSQICITNVAPTDGQASALFNMTLSFVANCPYMSDRILNQTQGYFNIQTDVDKKNSTSNKKRASILSLTGGCSSNSLRGRNNMVVIMDEMAFFLGNGGRFSGAEVYKALTPSTATFTYELDDITHADGKIICISSPYAKYGAFFDRFNSSFEEKDNTVMYKMYTAMVNPLVDSNYLKVERRRDRVGFGCEFGAEFSDKVVAWIDDENEFRRCLVDNPKFIQENEPKVDPKKESVTINEGDFWTRVSNKKKHKFENGLWLPYREEFRTRGNMGEEYYMGIDLGLKNDGTAISIVHRDQKTNKIVFDYCDMWFSGSSDIWSLENNIYSQYSKYMDLDVLRVSDIAKEINELCKWFSIREGYFDQWNGYSLMEQLQGLGLTQFRMEHVTDTINSNIFHLFKSLYLDEMLVLYDHPVMIPELLALEAELKNKNDGNVHKEGKGQNKIKVRAPNKSGAHDDLSDSLIRAVALVHKATSEGSNNIVSSISKNNASMASTARGAGYSNHKLSKQRMHGSSGRTVSKRARYGY